MEVFDREFFDQIADGSRKSAETIIPIVKEIIMPRSIVDIGCGTGVWLKAFLEAGVEDILGVDGEWVDKDHLNIDKSVFITHDLSLPLVINRKFDLAMSLEVAEHLPKDSSRIFIKGLVNLAPIILFSAAIPGQEGNNHINTQWPEYWTNLFKTYNYLPFDCLRSKIWTSSVEYWYAQNLILFADINYLQSNPFHPLNKLTSSDPLPLVHPKTYLKLMKQLTQKEKEIERLQKLNVDDLASPPP